jgi:hypothetical protein
MRPETRKSLLLTAAATLAYGGHHRGITHFNLYTAFWGHLIMRDIQARILEVIRNRCERKAAA